jgi:hypothetical protein
MEIRSKLSPLAVESAGKDNTNMDLIQEKKYQERDERRKDDDGASTMDDQGLGQRVNELQTKKAEIACGILTSNAGRNRWSLVRNQTRSRG